MTYRIIRHPEVRQDLFDLANLVAEFAGTQTALRKITKIEDRLQKLAQTPHVGTIRSDIYPHLRAIPVAQKGVIAFTVDDNEKAVYIIAISYAGADWLAQIQVRARE